MNLLLATRNAGKLAEFRELLGGVPDLTLRSLADHPGVALPPETAETLEENAREKAVPLARETGTATLAEDAGLFVPALGGAPGVRSARFAGESATDRENLDLLLSRLRSVHGDDRRAVFRAVVCYAAPEGEPRLFEGEVEGVLLEQRRGEGGFGYDPIFLHPPSGKTFAEMTSFEKSRVSHRGIAIAKFLAATFPEAR